MLHVVLVTATLAGVTWSIDCPSKTSMAQFDLSKYQGTWKEAYEFGPVGFGADNKCAKEVITVLDNNITVVDSAQLISKPGAMTVWPGWATLDKPGQFTVHQKFGEGDIRSYDLSVLGTDYENYAVVWSCPGFDNSENGWILTRKWFNNGQDLAEPMKSQVTEVLNKNQLDWSRYKQGNNQDCQE